MEILSPLKIRKEEIQTTNLRNGKGIWTYCRGDLNEIR